MDRQNDNSSTRVDDTKVMEDNVSIKKFIVISTILSYLYFNFRLFYIIMHIILHRIDGSEI